PALGVEAHEGAGGGDARALGGQVEDGDLPLRPTEVLEEVDEGGDVAPLGHVPLDPAAQRVAVRAAEAGEDGDLRPGGHLPQEREDVLALQAAEAAVEHDDVRLGLRGQLERALAVARLPDDLEPAAQAQGRRDEAAQVRGVIDEEYSNGHP